MKIGVCLIIKNENSYLEEWLTHYRSLGVDNFFIYDNNSETPITSSDDDVEVVLWDNEEFRSQNEAYLDCCKRHPSFDYIGFFDTDEFYHSKTMNVKEDISHLKEKFGEFSGLGIFWRMYGKPFPYFTERQPITNYTHYHPNKHIKSFIDPKTIKFFPDPHFPKIKGRYIDELGRTLIAPTGRHTSETIWIKHTWTRSENEFREKIERGDVNLRKNIITNFDDFYYYNDKCTLHDKND